MPTPRRNYGLPDALPREGRGELVQPERKISGRNGSIPAGTRDHNHDRPARFETIRNGAEFVAYDPSPEARARRRRDPRYRHARLALARAEAEYGPRPDTIRGLSREVPAA
jgi:hypothetical protein